MLNKTYYFILPAFFLITTILMYSWFNSGRIISNSEEELNIVNVNKTAENYSTPWYPPETGMNINIGLVRYPVFTAISFIESLDIPAVLVQAIFIGMTILVALISMFLLLKHFSGSNLIAFIGAAFYLLNLFSMSQIFRRLLYTSMFSWAYFPLFLFLLSKTLTNESSRKWRDIFSLRSKNLIYLSLFLLSSVIFSISFGHPSYILAFWFSGGLLIIFKLWQQRKSGKEFSKTLIFSIATFSFWIIVSSWWLFPMIKGAGGYFSEIDPGYETDLNSLRAVSKSFPVNEILLLRQSWWFGRDNHWFSFYSSPITITISIGVLIITLYGFIKSRKQPFWIYTSSLFWMGLFISKGTNFPLGNQFYTLLFSLLPHTRVLRNSYEKFGFVFLLAYSIFFALGVNYITEKINKKFRFVALLLITFIAMGILAWPMWSNNVFLDYERIAVPSYYTQANNYLDSLSDNRLFHLPVSKYGNVIYNWGYSGQDPSQSLFNRTSITIPTFLPLKNVFYKNLDSYVQDRSFPRYLGLLGIGEIIVHQDEKLHINETLVTTNQIKNWVELENTRQFGDLMIYSIKREYVRPKVYSILSKPDLSNRSLISEDNLNQTIEKLDFKKINNIKYLVYIKNSQEPFVLVLNDTFDNSWMAQTDSEILKNHFLINGFANGWLIEKKGTFVISITLKAWPWE